MPRRDPLQLLKETPTLSALSISDESPVSEPWDTSEKVKVTVQLPLKTSNELKKLAIDHRITRDHLLYCLVREMQLNPELMDTTLTLAKKTFRKL